MSNVCNAQKQHISDTFAITAVNGCNRSYNLRNTKDYVNKKQQRVHHVVLNCNANTQNRQTKRKQNDQNETDKTKTIKLSFSFSFQLT